MIDWNYEKLDELTEKFKNDNNYLSIDFRYLANNYENIVKMCATKGVRFPLLLDFELNSECTLTNETPSELVDLSGYGNLDDKYYFNDVFRKKEEEIIVNSTPDVNLALAKCFNFEVEDLLSYLPDWTNIIIKD